MYIYIKDAQRWQINLNHQKCIYLLRRFWSLERSCLLEKGILLVRQHVATVGMRRCPVVHLNLKQTMTFIGSCLLPLLCD